MQNKSQAAFKRAEPENTGARINGGWKALALGLAALAAVTAGCVVVRDQFGNVVSISDGPGFAIVQQPAIDAVYFANNGYYVVNEGVAYVVDEPPEGYVIIRGFPRGVVLAGPELILPPDRWPHWMPPRGPAFGPGPHPGPGFVPARGRGPIGGRGGPQPSFRPAHVPSNTPLIRGPVRGGGGRHP